MALALLLPAAAEPITLADAKTHLRADDAAEDALIGVLLSAARQWVEEECRRSLMPQKWRLTLDRFPCARSSGRYDGGRAARLDADRSISLPRGPVTLITSFKYIDVLGTEQAVGAGLYQLDTASLPAAAALTYGSSWPATRDLGPHGAAVTIEYTTGYAPLGTIDDDAQAAAPAALRAAILLVLGDLYANREAQIVGTIVNANPTAAALLGPYRILEAV